MSDPLFAGLTRPTLIMGIPADAFKVMVMVSSIIFVGVKSLWSLMAFPVAYIVVYLITYKDPNRFRLLYMATLTRWRSTFVRTRFMASSAAIFKPTRKK
ncbi:VirB3 family type IV secretion system protein [sulfur-oxidizing endosymbiont of Gigantopelta aegis]|uniref:VirB3 family type IV secretion system protein n=1 Tax=sulfur-oxidizing endosymbiont of Gigantopelta aegis TaxID=2794934 RepID=UPI0018DAFAD7|nr:VirB3 family type IV secretion system protein [sulfur-oxidizing endosymbiont of Gigantopelta aegis]